MNLSLAVLSAVSLFVCQCALSAQSTVDPTGHWEGRIKAENLLFDIAVDLAINDRGQLTGTFTQASQGIKGLPLATVAVDGRSLRLELRAGSGGGTFAATLGPDGISMTGTFATRDGAYTVPFELTRNGVAQVSPAPKNAAVAKELEGTWHATIDAGGQQERLVLTLTNQPDGTSTGTILSRDGSNIEIPVALVRTDAGVTIEVPAVSASFAAMLNTGATELAGNWTQGPAVLPVTFRRTQ